MWTPSAMEDDLLAKAYRAFPGGLSSAETKLLSVVSSGEFAYCGPSNGDDDPGNKPANSLTWSKERNVRAALIEWLCTTEVAHISSRGIRVHGAQIVGPLNLTYSNASLHLVFAHCRIEDPISMWMFFGREVSFSGSKIGSLDLERAQITGNLFLSAGFIADGVVKLTNAHVGEDLDCSGGTFNGLSPKENKYDDFALDGNTITVGADVNLEGSVFPNCGLNLANARLGGDIDAKGALFTSLFAHAGKGQSAALSMVSAQVRRDIYLGGGLKTQGGLALNGVINGGDIDFSGGAQLNSVPGEDNLDNDALDISDSRIDGNVLMDKGFTSHGGIAISSAHIGGYFQVEGAMFYCARGQDQAIYGNDSIVSGDISITGCKINGSVEWQTGEASGDFIMSNTSIRYLRPGTEIPAGCSLNLDRTFVHGSILLDGLEAFGYVSLDSAHIGAELVVNNAKLHGRVGENAAAPFSLLAENATIGTNLQAKNVLAEGLFSILSSTLGGQFDATGGTFINGYKKDVENSGTAINAYRVSIRGPVFFNAPFSSVGQVYFNDAILGANFEGIGGKFNAKVTDLAPQTGAAISLVRAQIGSNLLLRELKKDSGERVPFVSNGSIIFDYGQCNGEVFFDGARLINPYVQGNARTGLAFSMFSGKCARGLYFRNGFEAQGEVNVTNSDVSQVLSCRGGSFSANPVKRDNDVIRALVIRYTWAHGGIEIDQGFKLNGVLDLTDSTTHEFADDPTSWPQPGCLRLEGLKYEVFLNNPKDAKGRLAWLELQNPDPLPERSYLQLSKVLSQNGDDKGSQTVLIRLEDQRTRQRTVPRIEGFARRIFVGRTVGYGYTPINAIWGLAGLTALGWIIYRRAYLTGNIIPTDKDERASLRQNGSTTPEYGRFSPLIYSVENTVPLVKLGQVDKWCPLSHVTEENPRQVVRQWTQRARLAGQKIGMLVRNPSELLSLGRFTRPPWIRYFYWLQIVLGWILATLFVAGFSGLIHK